MRDNLRDCPIDGGTQADAVVVEGILADTYEFSEGTTPPTSSCSRIYRRVGSATDCSNSSVIEAVGPILVGMNKPARVIQRDDDVKDIVTLAAAALVNAQEE